MDLPIVLFLAGIALIFLGLILMLFYIIGREKIERSKTEGGVFLLIGPVPIVISSSKTLGYILLIVGVSLAILILLFTIFI